jgi:hypothetical protein
MSNSRLMSTFAELDKQLAARGWNYNPEHECFMDGESPVDFRELLALVSEISLDELGRYVEHLHDKLRPNEQ